MVKILVVDDSILMVKTLSKMIHEIDVDFEIISSKNGEDAIELYQKENPDILFLDIIMEGMDGMDVLKKIISINENAKIIMCTAFDNPIMEENAKKDGCINFIKKPFTKEEAKKSINLCM